MIGSRDIRPVKRRCVVLFSKEALNGLSACSPQCEMPTGIAHGCNVLFDGLTLVFPYTVLGIEYLLTREVLRVVLDGGYITGETQEAPECLHVQLTREMDSSNVFVIIHDQF